MSIAPARGETPGAIDAAAGLQNLSIEDLAALEVTSVLKTPQALSAAPAAVYVITGEEIRRSGAQSLPEALRLAPNLFVQQTSASDYVITARGLSGSNEAQNFANKLLVLIDGRSVYTPLFSGVYWDMQHVPISTIDRIEVISGPGATLWGANAVNGVINVITRAAQESQGVEAAIGAGGQTRTASAIYGGSIGADAAYRVYVQAYSEEDTERADGSRARDQWSRPQAGFRIDSTPPGRNAYTVQGDVFEGGKNQPGFADAGIAGHNLLARWTRQGLADSELALQVYWDRAERDLESGGVRRFEVDVFDVDAQHTFGVGLRHSVVWGGNLRIQNYEIEGTPVFYFAPPDRTLTLASLFVQDTATITQNLKVTAGVKAEDLPYTGLAWQPSVRLAWTPGGGDALVWAAASRAVRAATPFDRDVQEVLGNVVFLVGSPRFEPEEVTAYELGARFQPTRGATLSISAFHNEYNDLRNIEIAGGGAFIPLRWGNGLGGSTHGVEAWGDLNVTDAWRLSASYTWFDSEYEFDPGASRLLGVGQLGDDPRHRASLTSFVQLGPSVTFHAFLRYTDHLRRTNVPSHIDLNARLGWALTDSVEVSVAGANLLEERHIERAGVNAVPREVFAELRVRY